MNTGDASDDRELETGETTGQIRAVIEESRRMADRVQHQKRRVGQKFAALRRKLTDGALDKHGGR